MRPRDVLAVNLKKLMAAAPALSTFPQITAAGGGANGTLDRIRRKDTSTGVDNLAPLAEAYGLAPWQLLVPDLRVSPGSERVPRVESPGWPFETVPIARFNVLTDKQKGLVEAALHTAIKECEQHPTAEDRRAFNPVSLSATVKRVAAKKHG